MPFLPFILAAAGLGAAAWYGSRVKPAPETPAAAAAAEAVRRPIGDVLDFDEIHIEFATNLVAMALDPATGLDGRIANMRNHIAATYGLILPEIRLTDEASLPPGRYRIRIQGVERVSDRLQPDRVLVLLAEGIPAPEGEDVKEPVYGAPARWIRPDLHEDAVLAGLTVVSPAEVLATHLLEVLKNSLARLLSLRGLRRLLDEFTHLSDPARAEANRRLVDDLIPDKVPMDLLHSVLRMLLDERVSIRNLPLILEAIAEARSLGNAEAVCEHVRQRLGFQIVDRLQDDQGRLPLVQLSATWEQKFSEYEVNGEGGSSDIALPPELFGELINAIQAKLNEVAQKGVVAAVATTSRRRRFLQTVLASKGIRNAVVAYEEISARSKPYIIGVA
jgi:flagellar biosynthesis protein FlhA